MTGIGTSETVTPAATRAAAIKGAADIPGRSPFMLRPRCRTLRALSCSDPLFPSLQAEQVIRERRIRVSTATDAWLHIPVRVRGSALSRRQCPSNIGMTSTTEPNVMVPALMLKLASPDLQC